MSFEGGFVNDPDDLGGATNKGVTLATFRSVFGKSKTVDDLKKITDQQWQTIYKKYYWDKWKADQIRSQSVANILVDWIWMSGATSIKIIQRMLSLEMDGVVGPKTLNAINGEDPKEFFEAVKAERRAYYDRICTARPVNKKYLKGWLRRLDSIGFGSLKDNRGKTTKFVDDTAPIHKCKLV